MNVARPDLSALDPAVAAYIEALETELERLRPAARLSERVSELPPLPVEPSEPPTTLNVITLSAGGRAKRTPRHLYFRQRRGGMGIFDLAGVDRDPPALITLADESQALVFITDHGRAFRMPVSELPESPVHSRGQALGGRLGLLGGERVTVVFPDSGGTYLVLVTQRGQVRRLRFHYFGANLMPGTIIHDVKEGGPPAAACWTNGDGELFIATRKGEAIRFAERQVPVRGCLGMRVDPDDAVVAVAPVTAESGVFLLGDDGKGTIRMMAGFSPNKAPGAGGKLAIKTEQLVGATTVADNQDIFIISELGKLIRFQAVEVPAKDGVVQGVNCMTLRGDRTVAVVSASIGG